MLAEAGSDEDGEVRDGDCAGYLDVESQLLVRLAT